MQIADAPRPADAPRRGARRALLRRERVPAAAAGEVQDRPLRLLGRAWRACAAAAKSCSARARRATSGGAVAEAARRAAGVPLSAVVLVSDGAANVARATSGASCANLRARNLPVYTVGVGSARAADGRRAGARADAAARARRSSVHVEAFVRLSGYGATKVLIAVSEDGRAVKTEEFSLRGGETEAVRLELTAATCGRRTATRSRSRRSTAR